MNQFGAFVGMVFFAPGDNLLADTIRFNGTATFIDTGRKKLVVTNSHVFKRFKELREKEPSLEMFLTGSVPNQVLELREDYLVDDGKSAVDLVTFAFGKPDQLEAIGKSYFDGDSWPQPRPVPGVTGVVIGFPGGLRQPGEFSLRINLTVLCDNITSVSSRHLVLVDEEIARITVKLNPSLGELGALAGMSGSAVFAIGLDGKPSLAGLVYEGDEGADATLFVVHADFLTAERKIDYSKVV
jgi:hypothetical protein